MRGIALIIGTLVALVAGSALGQADKRVALVVGNSSYQNAAKLPTPAKDADAVAQMFKEAGYKVSLLKDVGSLEFKRGIRKFEDAASSADIAVVFYAGHGIEIGGTNYMIPVDAKLATDRGARDEAIELERIVESVEPAKRLRLVILDACRDNPFLANMKRGRQAMRAGLGPAPDLGSEILIAYAAKQGSTAEDGKGEHSPFTTAILNNLTEPGLDIRLAFGRVRDEVMRITNNRQEPYVYSSLGGANVSLVPVPALEKPKAVDPEKVRVDYEVVMKAFKDLGTKKPLEAFLDQYPTGLYSEIVRARLNQFDANEKMRLAVVPSQGPRGPTMTLPKEDIPVVAGVPPRQVRPGPAQPSQDTQAWDDVKDTTDPEAFRRFIKSYPNSPRSPEARHRLDILLSIAREREEDERRQKAEAEAEAKRQKAEADLAKAWEFVRGTDDQNRLRDFIRRYPDSQYATEAKRRLEVLVQAEREREEQARRVAAETKRQQAEAEVLRAFESVRTTTDQAVVRDFIRRYPDSAYVADAKRRLEALPVAEQERKEQERLAAVEAKRQKTEAEAASAWNSIKNTSDPAELQKFIKRFPETSLALNEATQRLGALDREARERVARTQAEAAVARSAWDRIKGTADVAEVENFIKLYPGTPTALTDAKQLLEVLDRRAKEREAKVRMEAEAAQAWNRINGTSDLAELRGFIKRFPNSPLALTDAAQDLAALERGAKDRAEKARLAAVEAKRQKTEAEAAKAWNRIKNTSDAAELQKFISRFPESLLALNEATLRLGALDRKAKERVAKAQAEAAAGLPSRPAIPVQPPPLPPPATRPVEVEQKMPEFPWPPPVASAFYVIPRELFVSPGANSKASLSDVITRLESALERAAYYERSFYSAPGGIAMITRMERIKQDGSPDHPRRWLDVEENQEFSLMGYLRALLFSDPGHFRLIVFIVTNTPFAAIGTPLSAAQGTKLLSHGLNTAPQPILQKTLLPDHQVSVLIYEFQKEKDRDPKLVEPSALPARTHLEKAKVWAGLNR